MISYIYVKWKGYDNSFNSWIDKKALYKMSQCFPKSYKSFDGDIIVKIDLSNYATKSSALKTNSANLKGAVDKLDIDELKPFTTDLSKLSNVVKNDVVKKTDYNKLVTKVNNIDTSGLVKRTDYNTKITEIEDKIPDTTNFATKAALTTVENKIPDISSLAEKSDYNREITGIKIKINRL